MNRRDALKSGTALAAASTFGLAGCLGGGCSTPDGGVKKALPESSDYKQQGDVSTSSKQKNVESSATAVYRGSNDKFYVFSVAKFSSAKDATEAATDIAKNATTGGGSSGSGTVSGANGYIVAKKYIYVGSGPSEDDVIKFMSTSPTLGDCVEGNIKFV